MQLFSADHIAEIPRKVVEMANLFFRNVKRLQDVSLGDVYGGLGVP